MIKFIIWLDEIVYLFALVAFQSVVFDIVVRIRGTMMVMGCISIG